ncbi:MAG: DUF1795 domain-containing protein [Deltaproteobacteria bacterium]|nr:DUF1795 domain-containing protein [Deltaproteobacteria bacterium]
MSTYYWQNLSFELPAGLHDETVLSFLNDANDPGYSLTVALDDLDAGLDAYSLEVVRELTEAEAGFSLERREKKKIDGNAAIIMHQSIAAEDVTMLQKQALVDVGDGKVAVVSITFTEPHAEGALACFNDVLKSLAVEEFE